MSRLLVKNLPHYVTPARLKEHFEQKGGPGGTITDFKVAFKQDGTSRRFGFIGYKTEKEALAAQEWFNRTYIDSTRIQVSVVDGAKDAPAPRPNKRPRLGPASDEKTSKASAQPSKPNEEEDGSAKSKGDRQLDRFLEVMQPRTKKGPSWANDATTVVKPAVAPVESPQAQPSNLDDGSTDAISDLDWMRRRMKKDVGEEKAFEQSDDEMVGDDKKEVEDAPSETPIDPTKKGILETGRLFLRNLAFACTDADLLELFKPFGDIAQVHIPIDSATKQPKGLAYVTFKAAEDAVTAYEALDKKSFQGRLLHIIAAVDRRPKFEVEDGEGKKSVKGEINAKRKAVAGKEFNWSMLYMNSDAVASSIANRMGISKADLLDVESGTNAAVKLALAETHIIQETKNYLESEGVLLSSFSSKARSDTTILVKNIPYGTDETQIREMFAIHGEISRVLVPPAGTMAVVEFDKPDEAAKAFRAIAYRRLGNSIIYLEKGPLGMFTDAPAPSSSISSSVPAHHSSAPIRILEQEIGDADAEEEPSISGGSTLFVKNLAFATTQEKLSQMFRSLPGFSFARLQTKPDPKRPDGARLSMGYGFVGFKDVESAKKAAKSMQGFVLDGHALHVKFAGRGTEGDKQKDKEGGGTRSKSTTTKMIVKNVPFEATKKDIRDLFGAHGHLKSVRLPKKFDSRSRGFAFLEFVSRREAENAYAMLKHTHLLGRHLVLEWAEEGDASSTKEAIEKLRRQAGVGFGDGRDMPGKKRKLDMGLGSNIPEGDEED